MNLIFVSLQKIDHYLAEKFAEESNQFTSIKLFETATDAMDFILDYPLPDNERAMIMMEMGIPKVRHDANRHEMDGFTFVNQFEKLPAEMQKQYQIHFFTHNVEESDVIQAKGISSVKSIFAKPFTLDRFRYFAA